MTNKKLTNRQAICVLDGLWSNPLFGEAHRQAFEIGIKAIKALEQEPCDDAISREDALMCLTGEIKETDTIETIIARSGRRIRKLPPVNSQPQTGWWIYGEDNLGTCRDGWYCNQCGHFEFWDCSSDMKSAKLNLPNPCPNCGAEMVEPQKSEE